LTAGRSPPPARRRRATSPASGEVGSAEDLAQLLSEGLGRFVALARVLDQALKVRLEVVVIHALWAALDVELDLQGYRIDHLQVNELVELDIILFASRCSRT